MRALFVLGRAIFGGFFVFNGVNHLQHARGMAEYAGAKGVPAAQQAVRATGLMLIAGGVSVVAAFGSCSSFSFQRNLKAPKSPGLIIACGEMRGSVRTQPVR